MSQKLLQKQLIFKSTAFDDAQFTIKGLFSSAVEDRQGEIVDQSGWKLDEYMQNPVILFAHDHYQPAIGKILELTVGPKGLEGTIQFAANEYDFAKTIYNLYKGGFMRAFSVGFQNNVYEIDQVNDVVILKENTLYEISAVNVPANAMALAYSKGIDMKPLERVMKESRLLTKGVVPYNAYTTAPENTGWDANTVQSDVWGDGTNQANYAKIHAWFDDNQNDDDGDGYPDIKSAYKLPHHDQKYRVIWRGVAAAMAALLGARGGVQIPDADKQGVYNHLAKHYAQFDKEVPEFKSYTEIELKQIEEYGNIQKDVSQDAIEVLTTSNKETIRSAIRTLTEVLNAESETDKKVGDKVEHSSQEGGKKQIPVNVLNKAIKELLKIKKGN